MIDKIILIPKDPDILEIKSAGFMPPQAFLDGTGSVKIWRRYDPLYNHPKNKNLHTFGLIFAWDKQPVYSGLDYFCRLYSGLPFESPLMWNSAERNLKDIFLKVKNFGIKQDAYGELVIINNLHQELTWPKLKVKDGYL
jgi:hypothetical protein